MKKKLLSLLTAVSLAASLFAIPVSAKNVNDYKDVPASAWYHGYVADVAEKELMTGLDENTFGPDVSLARGQFATVVYRMAKSPAVSYESIFSDVPDGKFFSLPVTWANGTGIVTGYSNKTFGPADALTREQMVTMLFRYAKANSIDTSTTADYSSFPDAGNVSSFASQAMSWAVGNKIVSGDQGKLNPQGTVSRAVCATMIARFTGYTPSTPDNSETTTPEAQNALSKAKEYLSILPFSYGGLINQLKFEGFSTADATYAADNCGADWNEQVLKAASSYFEITAFSYSGLIKQLEYDRYTNAEATYAADNCEADWNEQAAKAAVEYLDIMSFSREKLIEQLVYDGFTQEQAEYGVSEAGL